MTAPSPGIIATTMLNADYPSHEAYLDAIAREMAYEISRYGRRRLGTPDRRARSGNAHGHRLADRAHTGGGGRVVRCREGRY